MSKFMAGFFIGILIVPLFMVGLALLGKANLSVNDHIIGKMAAKSNQSGAGE